MKLLIKQQNIVNNDRTVNYYITREEMLSALMKNFTKYWDNYWNATAEYTGKGLHLLSIRDNVKNSNIYKFKCRRYEKVICRLRIGHVGLRQQLHWIGLVSLKTPDSYILCCLLYVLMPA